MPPDRPRTAAVRAAMKPPTRNASSVLTAPQMPAPRPNVLPLVAGVERRRADGEAQDRERGQGGQRGEQAGEDGSPADAVNRGDDIDIDGGGGRADRRGGGHRAGGA